MPMTEPSAPPADPVADIRQRPLLRPRIGTHPVPTLLYTDARGQLVALTLDEVDLAHLALSIAERQAGLARRTLATSGINRPAVDSTSDDHAA